VPLESAAVRPALLLIVVVALAVGACSDDGGGNEEATPSSDAGGGCGPARSADPGTTQAALEFDGDERTYELSIPPGYDGTTPAPLLLNLHGFGGDGASQNASTGMPEAAGERGYVVVAPDAGELSVPDDSSLAAETAEFDGLTFWNFFGDEGTGVTTESGEEISGDDLGADDVGFLTALIDELSGQLCIDADRVYSAGMSNGAGMTTTLGCELGDRLAAIAAVSGVNLTGACAGDAPVPVLAIHGDADQLVPVEGHSLAGFDLGNPSVPDRMAQWAERNGCDRTATPDAPAEGVTRLTWSNCVPGVDTELWTLSEIGHEWTTGTPIDATEVVLDFLDAHTLSDRS
jgi:polyhydroxybutyrate depolymerase